MIPLDPEALGARAYAMIAELAAISAEPDRLKRLRNAVLESLDVAGSHRQHGKHHCRHSLQEAFESRRHLSPVASGPGIPATLRW